MSPLAPPQLIANTRDLPAEPPQPVLVYSCSVPGAGLLISPCWASWGPCQLIPAVCEVPVNGSTTAPTPTQFHLQSCWEWLSSCHLSLRWKHQARLFYVPCPEKLYFWTEKNLVFNQWPLLLGLGDPTGFNPALQSVLPVCQSEFDCWESLGNPAQSLTCEKENDMHWSHLQSQSFHSGCLSWSRTIFSW